MWTFSHEFAMILWCGLLLVYMGYVSSVAKHSFVLDPLSNNHKYIGCSPVHALEPSAAITSTFYTTILVTTVAYLAYRTTILKEPVEKTIRWSLVVITVDLATTFCLGLILYLVDHSAALELTSPDNSVSATYTILFTADIFKILAVYKLILKPTESNTGALPDIISRQMIWVYKGVLILLFVARACQLSHLLWKDEKNLRQLFTTIAVIALVVIVVHQIKFLEQRPQVAHPNILMAVAPIVGLVVAPTYTTDTAFVSASKSFLGIFIYAALVSDCVESLVRETKSSKQEKTSSNGLVLPPSMRKCS